METVDEKTLEITISQNIDSPTPGAVKISVSTIMNPLESLETLLLTASVILRELKGVAENAHSRH